MTVERNKDGSITIKSKNAVINIGSVIVMTDHQREEKYRKWVKASAESVRACPHTFKETVQYFMQICDALPVPEKDSRRRSFQINVILNFFKDKLQNRPAQFSFEMTDEEMEKWHQTNHAMHEEIRNSSPEQFGLTIHGYYLPFTDGNAVYYKQASNLEACEAAYTDVCSGQNEAEEISFFFEEATEYWQCYGGGSGLMNQLIIFRGVNASDIENCSPRFLEYINALREMGRLPGYE